uniref:G-protein coupled receptors family 1 profile domain-containing protein n=1 Tax=Romanomermis culicivorax TaxID=13658 RepID=A0A915IR67_ROMCU
MSANKSSSLNATSSQSSSRSLHHKSSTANTSKNNGHCRLSSGGVVSGVSSPAAESSPTNKAEPQAENTGGVDLSTSRGVDPSTSPVTAPPPPTLPRDAVSGAFVQFPTSPPKMLKSQLSTTTIKLKTSAAAVADKSIGKRNGGAADGSRSTGLTKRQIAEAKRERRAGRTLAIITGIFVVCWLPFFLMALYRPLCVYFYCSKNDGHNDQGNQAFAETGRIQDVDGDCCSIPPTVQSAMAWLGYLNSALNPILYTIFSPDFRHAFKKLLTRFLRC